MPTIDPVEVKFLVDMSQMKRDMEVLKQMVDSSAGSAKKSLGGLENAFASLGRTAAGLIGVGTIVQFLTSAHTAALEAEKSQLMLSGALRATGHAAGLTRGEIEGLVDELTNTTIFDDEALREAAAAMLRFKNVQGETFKEGLKLAPDLAASLSTDVVDAARAIGRALEDPQNGMRGLKAAGVQLTEQQIDMAKKLTETGDKAGAAQIVIDALTRSVGGQAAESNQGLTGSTKAAKKAWGEFLEEIGNTMAAKSALSGLTETLTVLKQEINDINSGKGGSGSLMRFLYDLRTSGGAVTEKGMNLVDPKFGFGKPFDEQEDKKKAAAGAEAQRRLQEEEARYLKNKEAAKAGEDAAKRQKQEYDSLIKSLREKTAASGLELQAEDALTAGQKEALKIMVGLRDGTLKLSEAQKIAVTAELEAIGVAEQGIIAKKEAEKAQKEYTESIKAHFDPLEKQLEQLSLENEFHGKLASEIENVKAARIEEAIVVARQNGGAEEHIAFLEREAKLRRDLAGQLGVKHINKELDDERKKAEEDWKRTSENIERSLTDALMRGFEGGKDMGKNLRDTLYNMFRTLVLQPMLKPVAESMSKGITSMIENAMRGLGGSYSPSNIGSTGFFDVPLLPSAQGNVFAAPGLSAYSGQIVSRPTIFPFARGIGLMGEAGPEAVMPLKRGTDGRLGVEGGGSINITVNVPPGTAPDVRRAAGQGAREAVSLLGRARRYA